MHVQGDINIEVPYGVAIWFCCKIYRILLHLALWTFLAFLLQYAGSYIQLFIFSFSSIN